MKREWKPGDVALIEAGCHANLKVAIRTGVPSNMGWAYSDTHNGLSTQNWTADTHGTISVIRPLVVIDPEDRAQVERLANELARIQGERDHMAVWHTDLADALREFANPTPPRPDEPQGRGAVIEDASGFPYTRFSKSESCNEGDWINEDGHRRQWRDISAVRVLSEGVTP